MKKVLITGISGALGIKTATLLLQKGLEVKGFGHSSQQAVQNLPDIKFIAGDIQNYDLLKKAVMDVHIVIHLAALTGFHPKWSQYVSSNLLGTTTLLDILQHEKHSVRKIIFASTSAVYGEGAYQCDDHGIFHPEMRHVKQLEQGKWDPVCPLCHETLIPVPTPEEKQLSNNHIYAITKQVSERLLTIFAKQHRIPCICFRFPILYGTVQTKHIVVQFIQRILNSEKIVINEDGNQIRDFLFLEDAAEAILFGIEKLKKTDSYNVSLSQPISLIKLINVISSIYKHEARLDITQKYRLGDVRHIYLDQFKLKKFGFVPKIELIEGIKQIMQTNSI